MVLTIDVCRRLVCIDGSIWFLAHTGSNLNSGGAAFTMSGSAGRLEKIGDNSEEYRCMTCQSRAWCEGYQYQTLYLYVER